MARIRTVKPSFWTSNTTFRLSRDARLLAIGLISYADDDGRFPASVNAISGYVFPHDEITPRQIKRWLGELIDAGLVHVYQSESVSYGCFPSWHEHQVINRYTASTLPDPDIECVARRSGAAA